MPAKLRFEEMLPHEFDRAMGRAPIAYIPFGTLEWHDPHMALGNDAIKAYDLCLRAARKSGGVVFPPTYWASEGAMHHTVTIEHRGMAKGILRPLFTAIFREAERLGFKVIVALTGHYGLGQVCTVKQAAVDWMAEGKSIIWALAEWEVAGDIGYRGDHAGKWETSILWSLRPDLVQMQRLPETGRDGRSAYAASRALGDQAVKVIVERLADKAKALISHNGRQRQAFLRCSELYHQFLCCCMSARDAGQPGIVWRCFRTDPYEKFRWLFLQGKYALALKQMQEVGLEPKDLGPIP